MFMHTPMAFPGLGMHGQGSARVYTECIMDDIVCPAWCLMEDEWGCKSCPCGPANGMSPPVMDEGHYSEPEERKEEKHDCLGTILCMLSCKGNYKLGTTGPNGCQSCTCIRKNETTTSQASQDRQSTPAPGSHSNVPCAWPLCMEGSMGPNNGPGSNAGMAPLPHGGEASGAGGSIPGIDCIGPACSAKNGMKPIDQTKPNLGVPVMATPHPAMIPTPRAPRCPETDSCISSCKHTVQLGKPDTTGCPPCSCIKLSSSHVVSLPVVPACPKIEECKRGCPNDFYVGPKGNDGCHSCFCLGTTAPPKTLLLVPQTTPHPALACPNVDKCRTSCQYGFEVTSPRNDLACPTCNCIIPLSPPPPTTTKQPDFLTRIRVCPDAVHCMKSCKHGYTLAAETGGCPKCTCHQEPKPILLCMEALSCPKGCNVGYRCDSVGCPSCLCIKPSETSLVVKVTTAVSEAALSCNPKFSCVDRCSFGYRTGSDTCPTCSCLEPAKEAVVSSQMAVSPQSTATGIGCLGPACSATHGLGQGNLFVEAVNSSPQTHNTGAVVSPGGVAVSGVPASGPGMLVASGGNVQNGVIVVDHEKGDEVASSSIGHSMSAMEACPEAVQCMLSCGNTYKLTTIPGQSCPECRCFKKGCIGPSCSAPGSHASLPHSTPSPGQCVAILHCVMTCQTGYDVGDYGEDGCPSCTCLD